MSVCQTTVRSVRYSSRCCCPSVFFFINIFFSSVVILIVVNHLESVSFVTSKFCRVILQLKIKQIKLGSCPFLERVYCLRDRTKEQTDAAKMTHSSYVWSTSRLDHCNRLNRNYEKLLHSRTLYRWVNPQRTRLYPQRAMIYPLHPTPTHIHTNRQTNKKDRYEGVCFPLRLNHGHSRPLPIWAVLNQLPAHTEAAGARVTYNSFSLCLDNFHERY